mmetsp:Transcript_13015/g.17444  ORF Transcript_13015/g.17444 Transcript_13015/m.17444 type:complete len:103 (+) Transcript_13015:183-491(+)
MALGLFGVVKERGVNNDDKELLFYEALGSIKLELTTWNPIRMYRAMKEWGRHLKEKGIVGNYKGGGLVQGVLLLFVMNRGSRVIIIWSRLPRNCLWMTLWSH